VVVHVLQDASLDCGDDEDDDDCCLCADRELSDGASSSNLAAQLSWLFSYLNVAMLILVNWCADV
jgi:hypothetical protein